MYCANGHVKGNKNKRASFDINSQKQRETMLETKYVL